MIGEYTLEKLLKKYDVDYTKIVTKNNNILEAGEFVEIDKILNYLKNTLKIDSKNIEKCPSILYKNVGAIKTNVEFLQSREISFANIENCLHVLSSDPSELKDIYEYVASNYGLEIIGKVTSILSKSIDKIKSLEQMNLPIKNKEDIIRLAVGRNTIDEIKKIFASQEYKDYPEFFTTSSISNVSLVEFQEFLESSEFKEYRYLFTYQVLARADLKEIQELIYSEEFKKYPDLFTSEVLAHATLIEIQELIYSEEFKKYRYLFTSEVLAKRTLKEVQELINSEEFIKYPHLFTSQVLVRANIKDIQDLINSLEFKKYPDLFTSEVLARANLKEVQEFIHSEEFKKYPELFTSSVLAHANLKNVQEIINSSEFREYPELFTSEVLAKADFKEVKKIIHSEEFKKCRQLFTSEVLARTKLEDVQALFALPYWNEKKYKKLLVSSVVSRSKSIINQLPLQFEMAEYYEIDEILTSSFLRKSPSQNYALINYMIDNGLTLVKGGKLNSLVNKAPSVLKKKYSIDLKALMRKYPYDKDTIKNKKVVSEKTKSKKA